MTPTDGDWPGPAGPSWLRRPDGRVQVGMGPGAWVVQGWDPTLDQQGPASQLLRQLERTTQVPPPGPTTTRFTVVGTGQVADELRHASPDVTAVRDLGDLRRLGPRDEGTPVVLVSPYLVPVGSARHPALLGRSVLPVLPQTGRVVVGPWTGHPDGPCLHCLDLHRSDRDRDWPGLAAALDDPLTAPLPPRHSGAVVAAVTALVVLLVAAPAPRVPGVAHELGPAPPHVVTRRWSTHPTCPWHRPGSGG